MKKIGLLNFHYSNNNYGAVLQAAALENYIKRNFKLEIEHIDFIPAERKHTLRTRIGDLLRFLNIKKKIPLPTVANSIVFEDFRNKWMTRSKRIEKKNNLSSNNYWLVIVGSDQVWRPKMTSPNELVYFLSFCDNNCLRASYAASFGVEDWDCSHQMTKEITKEIGKFKAISCREKSGLKICKDIFDKDSTLVLDPTLLMGVDFFEEIIANGLIDKDETYNNIVYYKLDLDEKFTNQMIMLEEELNVDSKNIYYEFTNDGNKFISVHSWLNKIKNSRIVITDSFHCVCFSILFNKPFLFYPNKGRGLSRLESLLSILELEHLICYDSKITFKKEAFEINYDAVNEKLKSLRDNSHLFLDRIIKNHER